VIAPPLSDVVGIGIGPGQVVVRPFVRQCEYCRTVEHNEGELRQVDLVDLNEDLLAHAGICRRLFLGKQLVQAGVAVEVDIVADLGTWLQANKLESSGS